MLKKRIWENGKSTTLEEEKTMLLEIIFHTIDLTNAGDWKQIKFGFMRKSSLKWIGRDKVRWNQLTGDCHWYLSIFLITLEVRIFFLEHVGIFMPSCVSRLIILSTEILVRRKTVYIGHEAIKMSKTMQFCRITRLGMPPLYFGGFKSWYSANLGLISCDKLSALLYTCKREGSLSNSDYWRIDSAVHSRFISQSEGVVKFSDGLNTRTFN